MADTPTDEIAARRAARKKPGTKTGKLGTTNSESGSRAVIAARKQARALQLRVLGVSLQAIADDTSLDGSPMYADPSSARKAIMTGLRANLPDELRDDARRLELAKLDRLEQANWTEALQGNEKAAAIIVRCVDLRSKLLGLHAPQQVDVSVREGELVRVEILDLLNDQAIAALAPFQDEMVRMSELRAGAIEIEPTTG